MIYRLAITGPPGSGKGTVAEALEQIYDGIVHVSTGNLLRDNIRNKTPLGQEAEQYVHQGSLVPDKLINGMVEAKLAELGHRNFLLDGYPRTPDQAVELDRIIKWDKPLHLLFYLECNDEEILKRRITGRRVCINSDCARNYNIYFEGLKPGVEGRCNDCNSELTQRADDSEEKFGQRLEEFEHKTKPAAHLLALEYSIPRVVLDAAQERTAVLQDLCNALCFDFTKLELG